MPDEATVADPETTPDTPAPEATDSQEGTPAPESTEDSTPTTDYESRYKELQAEYTRTTQALSALQGHQGPEAQAQILQALGLELEDVEPDLDDDEYSDPDERIARIEAQLAERDQRTQAEQAAAQEQDWLAENLDALEKREGAQLSDEEVELVIANALANRLDDGQPNIDGAFKALRAAQAAYQKSYVESKKAPKVPIGTEGDQKIDLSDTNARRKVMLDIMESEGSD